VGEEPEKLILTKKNKWDHAKTKKYKETPSIA
jgi:hypothetical protein